MATAHSLKGGLADQRWRLNNLYWITDKEGKRQLFSLNWAQEDLFENFWYLNLILKARQLGFSTFIQIFMLDECLFSSNIRAGVIAHNREDAESIFKDKIRFAYDNLAEGLRTEIRAAQESARELQFSNNSSIRVGTSLRSGTLQYLHVSEYGKICAQYPEKAREVRTGAFNTVQSGQIVFVESTAQGQEGHFFEMCQSAQSAERQGQKLTPMDFKFHFYPWWKHPDYRLGPEGVLIEASYQTYFTELRERHDIELDAHQRAWYVKKAEQQGADMKREFPSTPEEAFEASIEGAYYSEQLAKADTEKRIGHVLHQSGMAVETWWDLGLNDLMSIWWVQRVGTNIHLIDYYENSGEGLEHYAGVLQERQRVRRFVYGEHVWPHDGGTRVMDEKGRKRSEVMRDLGYQVTIVERGGVDQGIEATRNMLSRCWFDAELTAQGLRGLRNYRKEWDEDRATWKPHPFHNWASNPADALRTGAMHRKKTFSRPPGGLAPKLPIV